MNETRSIMLALGLAAALVAAPSDASAQFSFEGRVGSAIPTGELTNEPGLNQTAGFSFAVDGMVSLNDLTTAYAGVSRQSFNCDGCATDVSTTGFNGGLKFILGSGVALPWVRGGLMLHRAQVDADSNDWGVGVDAGAGDRLARVAGHLRRARATGELLRLGSRVAHVRDPRHGPAHPPVGAAMTVPG